MNSIIMAHDQISIPCLLLFLICTLSAETVSHAARTAKFGEDDGAFMKRRLLDNGLGQTPQMG